MKKIVFTALSLACILNANQMMHQHHSSDNEILSSMHAPMMNTTFSQSGDLELDFLSNMIPHHQGAIDSSKLLLASNPNEKLKNIALNIIKTQEQEIKEFQELLQNKNYDKTQISKSQYENFVKNEKTSADKMMQEMSSIQNSDNIQKDYVKAMLIHHQGAVESAKNTLKYSKDTKIRAIAQKIIKDQEQEIKEFNMLLKTLN